MAAAAEVDAASAAKRKRRTAAAAPAVPASGPRFVKFAGENPAAYDEALADALSRKLYETAVKSQSTWMLFERHVAADGSIRSHVAVSPQWRTALWTDYELWCALDRHAERAIALPESPVDTNAPWPETSPLAGDVRKISIRARQSESDNNKHLPKCDELLRITVKRPSAAVQKRATPAVRRAPSAPPPAAVYDDDDDEDELLEAGVVTAEKKVMTFEAVALTYEQLIVGDGPEADFHEVGMTIAWLVLPYMNAP
jgi:hypothetical protein